MSGKYQEIIHIFWKMQQSTEVLCSTPKRFIDNSPMSPVISVAVINPSARKLLYLFTEVLDAKRKTSVHRVGAAKSKHKASREVSMLWSSIKTTRGHTKIYERVKKYLYNYILQHPRVVHNMALLIPSGKYGALNTTYMSTMGCYVIDFSL